jgi:AcrR family transcriptional regulator
MRARLLEATFDCLAETGYARTTTTEVARRAGVSRGAQLHHFPSKVDLVVAAQEHVLALRQRDFVAAFGQLPAAGRTEAAAIGLLWTMYQGPTYAAWLELAVAARSDPELHARFLDVERRYAASVAATFVELYPDTPGDEFSRLGVEFALALLDGLALRHAVGCDIDADQIVELLKRLADIYAPAVGGKP